jgi:hypothetical protein
MMGYESIFRILLGVINVIYLLLGIAFLTTASILKWSNINKLKDADDFDRIVNSAAMSVGICIASFIILISIFGIIGVWISNRCFLIMYEIFTIIFFVSHGLSLVAIFVLSPKIEQQFRVNLNNTMDVINKMPVNLKEFKKNCEFIYTLSVIFKCCGANGPSDFASPENLKTCCMNQTLKQGCADASVDWIQNYSTKLLVIPISVILFVELVLIIIVPLTIREISRPQWAEAFNFN